MRVLTPPALRERRVMPHDSSERLQNSTMFGDSARARMGRDAGELRSLPFHVGVLADLTGHPTESRPKLRDRSFVEISSDRTDTVLASLQPHLKLSVENKLVASGDGGMLHLELHFRRILCFEPRMRGSPPEVVGDIFRSLAPFLGGPDALRTVAMPLIACGNQMSTVGEILEPLLDAAVHWMSLGLPLERLKIVENRAEKAIELQRLFGALRHKYEAITPTAGVHRYDVFVSYAHADVAAATSLVDALQADWPDLRVFFDRRSLDTGVAWQQEIFEAIDASRRVVALYSPAYLASKVCKEEFNIALFRQRESEELVLFPVFLYSAPLPTYMRLVQFADCREGRRDELRRAGARLVSGLRGPPTSHSAAVP